ncbi:DUF2339 domain-containing protein [Cryomorphaceae bacterium 1068]|nr:DUF2339 domain-containing protein [Cryomorphaceae bacterium 1068]
MKDESESNKALHAKLEKLIERQASFAQEIKAIKKEIEELTYGSEDLKSEVKTETIPDEPKPINAPKPMSMGPAQEIIADRSKPLRKTGRPAFQKKTKRKSDLEKFIGENLISKIGIAITIIGVAIGAKYSIEHELISPLTRIILGYLAGIGLMGFGIKLKQKYTNFSAVLVSGAIAILYFITFAAFDFYSLIPKLLAFALMVIFTAFGVIAAIKYNRQVIAHIGLVGAYAVPFLLSDGTGEASTLFAYIAIINIGILAISFKRYWKSMYYAAFGLTWLIFLGWFAISYYSAHFKVALFFVAAFFVIFYAVFLAYKLLRKEEFKISDVVLLLINSFIFYGIGYSILSDHETGQHLLGAFTLGNALIHFSVAVLIFRQKKKDQKLSNLIIGLVLVFITVTIPVQLDDGWVTLLWAGQACLLFWIGRAKKAPLYERLSYPLMLLAFISLNQDWSVSYHNYYGGAEELWITPIFNVHFLTSMLFIGAFSIINFINSKYDSTPALFKSNLQKIIQSSLPAILLYALYFSIYMEISNYWTQQYALSEFDLNQVSPEYGYRPGNTDLNRFRSIWIINYTMLFFTALALVNFKRFKSKALGIVNLICMAFALFLFLSSGLYSLSLLRDSYLSQSAEDFYTVGLFHIVIRYISIGFFALMLYTGYNYVRQDFIKIELKTVFNILLHAATLWILSSELIHLLEMAGTSNSYKLGLTILWSAYALFMIVVGISRSKRYLRIAAFIILGITILKLFFYDTSDLNTIAKTIVFVSVGILLLVISFLYNKYKQTISNEPKE